MNRLNHLVKDHGFNRSVLKNPGESVLDKRYGKLFGVHATEHGLIKLPGAVPVTDHQHEGGV